MARILNIVAILLIAYAALSQAFLYNVIVETGYYFTPTNGSIKVTLNTGRRSSDEFRVVDNSRIEPSFFYNRTIDLPFNVQQILTGHVRFTLQHPITAVNRKISVFNLQIVPLYIQNQQFRQMESFYLRGPVTEVTINHRESATFTRK